MFRGIHDRIALYKLNRRERVMKASWWDLFFVKAISIALLATMFVGCSNRAKHADIKVKALHAWERGRAKNCMLLTGQPIVQGGKPIPDPKEMWCSDHGGADPDEMNREYVHIANVTLDNPSEQAFHDRQEWAVPLVCEEVSSAELKCVFDGTVR